MSSFTRAAVVPPREGGVWARELLPKPGEGMKADWRHGGKASSLHSCSGEANGHVAKIWHTIQVTDKNGPTGEREQEEKGKHESQRPHPAESSLVSRVTTLGGLGIPTWEFPFQLRSRESFEAVEAGPVPVQGCGVAELPLR